MIIERLDLKAFGRFTDVSIDLSAGPKRFHLVYGPNESGKSTSLRAISSWLFGIPHITEDNYQHSNTQMRVGGVLVDSAGKRLECIRRRGRKATLRGADDSEALDELQIQEMLGGINRDTFLTRFGLSHDELVAGGAAILGGEGDLGQVLFAAGAGVGRLRGIQDELDESANKLFTPRSGKGINASLKELDEQRKQLRAAQVPPAEYSNLCSRIDQKREQAACLAEQLQQCVVDLGRLRNYEQALPLLPEWRSTGELLGKGESTPMLDEAFTERRRQAVTDREVAISRQSELETRIAELTRRIEALPVDAAVIQHETEIQAVFQEVATRDKADRDRLDLVRVQNNTDRKITDLLRELSVQITANDENEKAEAIDQSVERLRVSETIRSRIHDLAAGHERLIGRRNDASDAVETTKRRLSDISTELETLGTPNDPEVVTAAIEAVGNPQSILATLAEQQDTVEQLVGRCEDQLQRLDGFDGTRKQAANLQPPSESVTQRMAESLRSSYQQVSTSEEQAKTLKAQCDELASQIRQDQTSLPLPTTEELSRAREVRDQATDRVSDAARERSQVDQAIESLRKAIRVTDQLADTMRLHSEQVHRREARQSQWAAMQTQVTEAEAKVATAKSDFQAVKEQWLSLWEQVGVTAGQPEQMQRWLSDHQQLCELVRRLGDEEKRLEQTQQQIKRASARLRTALSSSGSKKPVTAAVVQQGGLFDETVEDDLISLYDEAVSVRSQTSRVCQQFDTLARRREELVDELPEAETKFDAAQKAVEQWREDWQRTTESFVSSENSGTREVLQMLDQIHELCNKKRERDILATRIRSIGEDELAYAARVRRLASATGESFDESVSPTAMAQSLYQRLQAERKSSQGRETLREQFEGSKQRLAEVATQWTACEVVLEQLCKEAGCQSAEELPEIERAGKERSGLQARLRDLENQLSILAGDEPLEQFVEAAGHQKPALLEVELEQKETELRSLRQQVAVVQQEIGAVQHELNLMDGGARASELVQTIEFTAGRISHDAEQFARTKIASLILRRAIEHYRRENQSPVLALASKIFQNLTCGEYRDLKPDYDAKGKSTLFGISARGVPVPAGAMSAGTADALYLALRLASLQHQTTRSNPIPLIIDDCLIQLDDARAAACLQAFSDLSEKTQVILFTHHEHLLRLAEENLPPKGFHVHQLGC